MATPWATPQNCVSHVRLAVPGRPTLEPGSPCQPTTGVEHWQVLKRLQVTEIGSAVGGLWPHYIATCTAGLMYFVDVTAKAHISYAAMELHSIVAHDQFTVCLAHPGSLISDTQRYIFYKQTCLSFSCSPGCITWHDGRIVKIIRITLHPAS